MSTLAITSPAESSPVKAGMAGEVHCQFTPTNIFVVPGSVTVSITDGSGKEIWKADAPIVANQAWLQVSWPATPGAYQVSATAYGFVMANVLADATHQFTVIA